MKRFLKKQLVHGTNIALVATCIVAVAIGAAFAQDSLEDAMACDLPSNLKNLSDCVPTNMGPTPDFVIGQKPTVAGCSKVKVDRSFTQATGNALGKITIDGWGSLFVPDQTVEIETKGIDVSGVLQVGTAQCPIGTTKSNNKVTITFTGARPSTPGEDHTKGIVVNDGGNLLLFGAKGVAGGTTNGVSWTHLKEAAGPLDKYGGTPTQNPHNIGRPVPEGGDTTLQLAKDVTFGPGKWQDGDWIAVATTSFSPFETEFVQINAPVSNCSDTTKVCPDGSKVTLKQKLQYYHFGGPDPGPPSKDNFNAGPDKNYGVDERAEVGLISRNIKLTAKIEPGDTNKHWGGEIRILKTGKGKNPTVVSIQGVEIEKFGKDQIGSYPIHFHLNGDFSNKPVVNANSVHHSFNKCVTIHSTQNMTVQNMVCARIIGHIFYQEIGDEFGVKYRNNLALGAMSHYFDINAKDDATRQTMIEKFWWIGDNLAKTAGFGYDGFRVPNTDGQSNPTHGRCTVFLETGDGSIRVQQDPPCAANQFYTEPPSGFWIINPGTELVGNSIGGCQGTGRGYWYVPPTVAVCPIGKTCPPDPAVDLHILELGNFDNNRVHGCWGGLLGETDGKVMVQQSLFPVKGGVAGNPPLIVKFNGITVTRNRGRGIWLRPTWYAVTNARLATNRLNVTLVSSGGLDGNSPGVWDLLQDSVVVGQSTNNVDRFGPCPTETPSGDPLTNGVGGKYGCIDQTPGPQHTLPVAQLHGGDIIEDCCGGGYPTPDWNFFGYMIYDGPVRIFDNHFVNFRVNPMDSKGPGGSLWTTADQQFFTTYAKAHPFTGTNPLQDFIYEGDAALGWFDSNQSAYPTSTAGKGFHWTNVDLRHQIFTENVSRGGSGAQAATQFNDGDKNTAIIDLDGSLTGFKVRTHDLKEVKGLEPISLNNLPFNASSNSVDECLAEGGQDNFFEGRPTSLISPGSMATLEFGALWPNLLDPPNCQDTGKNPAFACNHTQIMTISKDSKDFGQHQTMALHSRDRRGVWEPKVTSGLGYTVAACASKDPVNRPTDVTCNDDEKSANFHNTGMPSYLSVGLTDPVKPDIDHSKPETWFAVRLGICYTDKDGKFPSDASKFSITRGYKSYGGGETKFDDDTLRKFFNKLDRRYNNEFCDALDQQDPTSRNLCPDEGAGCTDGPNKGIKGCPANGVSAVPEGGCKAPSTEQDTCKDPPSCTATVKGCVFPKTELAKAASIKDLEGPVLDKYFYDPNAGMLYFNVIQDLPNAFGPSPLGSCNEDGSGDSLCPKIKEGESYYACPAAGCVHYVVKLLNSSNQLDTNYQPGRSKCLPYSNPDYVRQEPANQNVLVKVDDLTRAIETTEAGGKDGKFPHHVAKDTTKDAPVCKTTTTP